MHHICYAELGTLLHIQQWDNSRIDLNPRREHVTREFKLPVTREYKFSDVTPVGRSLFLAGPSPVTGFVAESAESLSVQLPVRMGLRSVVGREDLLEAERHNIGMIRHYSTEALRQPAKFREHLSDRALARRHQQVSIHCLASQNPYLLQCFSSHPIMKFLCFCFTSVIISVFSACYRDASVSGSMSEA